MTEERDPQTYAILGAAMEVHSKVGSGFLETVYQECFEIELGLRGIPFARETAFPIDYKGHRLKTTYRGYFVCYESVIVEIKALSKLTSDHKAQVINYLKATGLHRALLLNFGAVRLEWERIVLDYKL